MENTERLRSSKDGGIPSRTTVDSDGIVWVANREDVYGNFGSVTHIGLLENGQCEDRNKNGVIDTSRNLSDIKPWVVPDDKKDDSGASHLAQYAEDACITHYVKVNSLLTRHISVNGDNDVWVSGWTLRAFDLIKGGGPTVSKSGTINTPYASVGYGGYGGLMSGDVLWSAGSLLRWNTKLPLTGETNGNPPGPSIGPPVNNMSWAGQIEFEIYGLCLEKATGNVWNTGLFSGEIVKYASDGAYIAKFSLGNEYPYHQGCAVDNQNNVWIANSKWSPAAVTHLKSDGTFVGIIEISDDKGNRQEGTTGVAVDPKGKIWATNYYSHTVSRIDPTKGPTVAGIPVGEVDLTVFLGENAFPYDYSDMTGSTLTSRPTTGRWIDVIDSGEAGHSWSATVVSWNANVPDATTLSVKVSSGSDGIVFGADKIVNSGSIFTISNGQYLKIQAFLGRASATTAATPVLFDLKVEDGGPPPPKSTKSSKSMTKSPKPTKPPKGKRGKDKQAKRLMY